jgi:hypothetical protein
MVAKRIEPKEAAYKKKLDLPKAGKKAQPAMRLLFYARKNRVFD